MHSRLSFFFFLIGVPLIVIAMAVGAMVWQPTPTTLLFAKISLYAEGIVLALGLLGFAGIALAVQASRNNRERLATLFRAALYATEVVATLLMLVHTLATFSVIIALLLSLGQVLPKSAVDGWDSIARRVVGPAIVGMLIFAGATVWRILRSMRNANKPLFSQVLGTPLPEAGNEAVWSLVRNTARQLNATLPENIVAGLDANFFVTEAEVRCPEARLSGRTLFLSLPLCRVMSVDELKAIIAHELAHFKGEDTAYARKFAMIYRSASEALTLPNTGSSAAYALVLSGPAYGLLGHFLQAFAVIENAMSRERELVADQSAEQTTSSHTYGLALTRVHLAGAWEQHTAERMRNELAQKSPSPKSSNISQLFEEVARSQIEVNEAALIQHTVPHPVDSHPPLAVRLQAHQIELNGAIAKAKLIPPQAQTAITLFTNAERLEESLTKTWVALTSGETIADRLKQTSIQERGAGVQAEANQLPREIVIRPKGWKLVFNTLAAAFCVLFFGFGFAVFAFAVVFTSRIDSVFSWVMVSLILAFLGFMALYGLWATGYYLGLLLGRRPLLVLSDAGIQSFSEMARGDVLPWDQLDDIRLVKQDGYGMTRALCFFPKDLSVVMKRLPAWKRVMHRLMKRTYPVPHYASNALLPMKLDALYGLVAMYHDQHVAGGNLAQTTPPMQAAPPIKPTSAANHKSRNEPIPELARVAPVAASGNAAQPVRNGASAAVHEPVEDIGMNVATRQAQSTMQMFIGKLKQLNQPQAAPSFFSVRARLGTDISYEDLWLSELNFDGTIFRGRLDNEPATLRGYKPGDVVEVLAKEVRDWVIVENGQVLGGYTLREQRGRMTMQEQQAFDATMPGPFAVM